MCSDPEVSAVWGHGISAHASPFIVLCRFIFPQTFHPIDEQWGLHVELRLFDFVRQGQRSGSAAKKVYILTLNLFTQCCTGYVHIYSRCQDSQAYWSGKKGIKSPECSFLRDGERKTSQCYPAASGVEPLWIWKLGYHRGPRKEKKCLTEKSFLKESSRYQQDYS